MDRPRGAPSEEKASSGKQLALPYAPPRPRYRPQDFLEAEANRAAREAVDAFLSGEESALALCGPPGSGKSHFGIFIAARAGGLFVRGDALDHGLTEEPSMLVVDDAHLAQEPRGLFAIIEARRARGLRLVLIGPGRPGDWAGGLKDLETRLEAMMRARLEEPDESLLRAVIDQRFRDRQLRPGPGVAAYAAPRLPRTFAAAADFVEAAAALALAEGRPIRLALARRVLENLSEKGSGD